jgi:hypothetical protein
MRDATATATRAVRDAFNQVGISVPVRSDDFAQGRDSTNDGNGQGSHDDSLEDLTHGRHEVNSVEVSGADQVTQ